MKLPLSSDITLNRCLLATVKAALDKAIPKHNGRGRATLVF